MNRVNLDTKVKINFFFLAFENINMYTKGHYRIKVEGELNNEKCQIKSGSKLNRWSQIGKKQGQCYFTKEFMVRFQNERIELDEMVVVQSPIFKTNKDSKLLIKLTLLKAETCECQEPVTQYTSLRVSYGIIRFPLKSFFEYIECSFQEPFLATLSGLMICQPSYVTVDTSIKNFSKDDLLQIRKQVKKLRYLNYLLVNKFKKVCFGQTNIEFTLPKMFAVGGLDIKEVATPQQNFIHYLVNYEGKELPIETMNTELLSICMKNEELFCIFRQNCQKDTINTNKLISEFEEKQNKRYRLYIAKEQYKERFYEDYKPILREKLRVLNKQKQVCSMEEELNHVIFKMDNIFEQCKPTDVPTYPIIIHDTQFLKHSKEKEDRKSSTQNTEKGEQSEEEHKDEAANKKIRYILILGHGYQGSPDDLTIFANGFKKKYKKTKYLIIKSYKDKMNESINHMAKLAAEQINKYLSEINFKERNYRIVMAGHSMGGLVLRLASNLINHKELLYAYLSLGTPHLGYLQGLKLHIRAGLSLFSSVYSNPCLNELSGKDSPDHHSASIYKMSLSGSLGNFKKVIFVSSRKDKYVSWHSARVENYSKDHLKQYTFIEDEMVKNILGGGQIQRIDRLQIDFKLHESSSMDKIIGRTCHIKLLTDLTFIELLCNSCLPQIFEQ